MALVGSADGDTPATAVVAKLGVGDFKADNDNDYRLHLDTLVAEAPGRCGHKEGKGGQ